MSKWSIEATSGVNWKHWGIGLSIVVDIGLNDYILSLHVGPVMGSLSIWR